MTRQFIVRQGEDETPEFDLTDADSPVHVIWDEMEVGGRAFRGESDAGTIPARDERGETGSPADLPSGLDFISLSRGSTWEWLEKVGEVDELVMARGRIGPKDYSRGRQKADRAREVRITTTDPNEHLRLIIVDDWVRSSESDVTRVNALITDYLSGTPRPTTDLANTYVSSDDPITLDAQTYDGMTPYDVLNEIAQKANKNFFVTVDNEVFYDGWESTAYPAGLRISDRIDEMNNGEGLVSDADVVSGEVQATGPSGGPGLKDYTVTVPDTDHGLLVFIASQNNAGDNVYWDATSQFNGLEESFDKLDEVDTEAGLRDWHYQIWHLGNPAPGTGTVRIVIGASGDRMNSGVVVLNSPAVPDTVIATGTSTSPSTATGAGSGSLVVDFLAVEHPDTVSDIAPGTGQTSIGEDSEAQPGADTICAASWEDDEATMAWTITGSSVHEWGHLIAVFGAEAPTFGPIWDVGAASTEDGLDLRCGMRLYYGEDGAYVYHHDNTVHNEYWHAEESVYTSDPTITDSTKATALLEAMYEQRKEEERNYNLSIGPLSEDHIGLIKYGQLVDIKARAIPDADDQFQSRRIAQLRWTTPRPGVFFARMQLNRPRKQAPVSIGPKDSTDAIKNHKEGGSHPASSIPITDSGGYFTGTDVEAALQELGAGGGGSGIEVAEADGSPDVSGVTRIEIDGGTVTNDGGGQVTISGFGGGGGGLTHTYVGTNSVGGSTETMTTRRHYVKTITLASAGVLASIEAYISGLDPNNHSVVFGIWDDDSGSPAHLLQYGGATGDAQGAGIYIQESTSADGDFRWFGCALNRYLTAGTYWIGLRVETGTVNIAYNDTGADKIWTATVSDLTEGANGIWTITDSTNSYSIRASVLT